MLARMFLVRLAEASATMFAVVVCFLYVSGVFAVDVEVVMDFVGDQRVVWWSMKRMGGQSSLVWSGGWCVHCSVVQCRRELPSRP